MAILRPVNTMLFEAVFCSLLLIVPVLSNHISGTVNRNRFLQRELPVEDVSLCIRKSRVLSLNDIYKNVLDCYRSSISNCLPRSFKPLDDKTFTQFDKPVYCGAIITGSISQITTQERTLHIQVMQGFIINANFHFFDFQWHPSFYEHGLSFSEPARKDPPFYSGIRLPWRVFVPDNKATIFISTWPYMKYFVSLSYIRYKFNWLIDTCFVDHKFKGFKTRVVHFNTLSAFLKASSYNVKVASIKYHLIGKALSNLRINFFSERKSNTRITLHDGPGKMSQPILNLDCMITCNNGITASTFIAYIIIENILHKNEGHVEVRFHQSGYNYRDCTVRNHVIEEVSNSQTNTICSVRYGVYYDTLKLHLDYFQFWGPNAVVPNFNVESCQYGGYFFNLRKRISLCETLYRQPLYAGNHTSMVGLLVWFKGYSGGVFRGRFVETDCATHYIGLTSDNVETTVIDDSIPCQTYICSPTSSREGRKCNFKLRGQSGRPIGNAVIVIQLYRSLYVCYPSSDNTGSLTYNMTTWSNPKWPLGETLKDKSTHELTLDSVNHHTYRYLIRSSFSMPIVCNSSVYQIAVKQMTGMCRFLPAINKHSGAGRYGLNMMSTACYGVLYSITSRDLPQVYFVEDSTTNYPATIIDTYYSGSCPVKCRNFTYVVYILNNIENTVVEREANVDQAVFTGFQFHGLRVDIKGPKKPCSWSINCQIDVAFIKEEKEVGVALPHTWTLNSVTYRFHTRR